MTGLDKYSLIFIRLIGIVFLFISGCANQNSNLYTETPAIFNSNEINSIGIVKFTNRSEDPNAGKKVADIFFNELLSYKRFQLTPPAKMSEKEYKMEFVKTLKNIDGLLASPNKKEKMDRIMIKSKDEDLVARPELDAIVTGIISRYNDKDGNAISVSKPASVAFSVYLIRVEDNKILWSANFAETQEALLDNLLLADRFTQAGGVWMTSDALAQSGMQRIIKTFPGLSSEKLKQTEK